jgi:hypothetical protein
MYVMPRISVFCEAMTVLCINFMLLGSQMLPVANSFMQLGTKEQHFFREDPRTHKNDSTNSTTPKNEPGSYLVRGLKRYKRLNALADHEDHGMLGWVHGFVKDVGWKTAKALLDGVGEVGVE